MRRIKLVIDHRRWVDGKCVLHKAGETISVTNNEFEFITNAVRNSRVESRSVAQKTLGTPEWKFNRDR